MDDPNDDAPLHTIGGLPDYENCTDEQRLRTKSGFIHILFDLVKEGKLAAMEVIKWESTGVLSPYARALVEERIGGKLVLPDKHDRDEDDPRIHSDEHSPSWTERKMKKWKRKGEWDF